MKEELYRKISINSIDDLPKAGLYFCAITDECFGCFHFNPDDKDDIDFWIGNVMWYLQPIEPVEAEKKEKYPVIAIEDIDVETVKRWFQLFMGFKDDSKMKADIRAMARASHLNKHLNWEEAEKDDYGDCTFCGRAHSGKCNCS